MEHLKTLVIFMVVAAVVFVFGIGSCTSSALQDDYHINKEACEYVEKSECKQVWMKK